MQKKHASALDVMALAVNYNNWIFRMIKPYIGKRVLEVGCGIGNITKLLVNSEKLVCLDFSRECIDRTHGAYRNHQNIECICGDITDGDVVNSLKEKKIDTVICLNVLEHIEKDSVAIKNMVLALGPQGTLILVVPAMQGLYGSMDRALGHVKRYNKTDLINLLRSNGFSGITIRYFNSLGIFGWYLNGKILKKNNLSRLQALIYDMVFIPFLAFIEDKINPPFGMSLVAIAKKS